MNVRIKWIDLTNDSATMVMIDNYGGGQIFCSLDLNLNVHALDKYENDV